MAGIQALILDLGKVVLNYDHGRSAREIARISGCGEKEVESFIFGSLKDRFNSGQMTGEEFFGLIKDRFNLKISFDDFHPIWSDIFSENLDVAGVLPELCKNYPVYLLTNTDILHFEYILANFPVVSRFNQVFASYQMGIAKPDREIYQRALAEIGMPADAVLYVDDEPAFVEAARLCGINALLYRPGMSFRNELLKFGISI
ncbi:MAG: HAD family phosphatase [bacterium]|nr:HAD family phosphatase [bacterium]